MPIRKIISDKNKICDIAFYNHDYAKKHFMASIVADDLLNIYLDTSHNNSCNNNKI